MIGQKAVLTADGSVSKQRGAYWGYTVSTVTATAAILIYDNASTNSGTVIDTIPIGTAVGTQKVLPASIRCDNGIYAKFGTGTGTICFLYD